MEERGARMKREQEERKRQKEGNNPNPNSNANNPNNENKQYTQYENPFCKEEADASMKCLHDNNHIRDKCLHIFQLYRDCKKDYREKEREKVRQQPFF